MRFGLGLQLPEVLKGTALLALNCRSGNQRPRMALLADVGKTGIRSELLSSCA